jgi:integrase
VVRYIYHPHGGKIWRGRYRLSGDAKIMDVALHTKDKQVAEETLRKIVQEKEQERQGIIPPKALREGAKRSLQQHLADYIDDLNSRQRDDEYVYNVERLIRRLIADCRWIYPADVTADSFLRWRSKQSRAAKTLNEYLASVSALLNWMVRNGRILTNPLRPVALSQTRGNERRKRRALSHDEASRLLAVAGPYRVVYLTALLTGLRRSELRALIWEDLSLDSAKPSVRLRAEMTKNRKDDVIALHPELAAELLTYRPANAQPFDPVFPKIPSMDQHKKHLTAARIPYLDRQGRQADFHALRHTFGTNLSLAGVTPRIAMQLMRHSDLRLTMKVYTDAGSLPTAEAIAKLPGYK